MTSPPAFNWPQQSYSLLKYSVPAIIILSLLIVLFFGFRHLFSLYVRQPPLPSPPLPSSADVGLEQGILDKSPIVRYDNIEKGRVSLDCHVCLSEFKAGDGLRILRVCGHGFHTVCIDRWLATHVTCPVCRLDLTVVPEEAAVMTAEGGSHVIAVEESRR